MKVKHKQSPKTFPSERIKPVHETSGENKTVTDLWFRSGRTADDIRNGESIKTFKVMTKGDIMNRCKGVNRFIHIYFFLKSFDLN